MRLHIELDDALVAEIDRRAGSRNRSAFVRRALTAALEAERRWELIESGAGSITDGGHEWDVDPSGWVRGQRLADPSRVG